MLKSPWRTVWTFLTRGGLLGATLLVASALQAQTPPRLNENCIVSVLNRNVRVKPDGSWVLPNIPANFGLVRARATCIVNGETISGESAPFVVAANLSVDVPPIVLGPTTPIPQSLTLTSPSSPLGQIGATAQLAVMARYADNTTRDVTAAATGTRYVISNPAIATITANGLLTALASGTVVIQATNEGTAGFTSVRVVLSADSDGDGLPDDLELSLGLNPNNPADAFEDIDRDGASNRDEALAGSNLRDNDSDDDGLLDGEELQLGIDGFVTNPLSADTDGDGVRDALEVQTGSNPTDATSVNLAQALQSLTVAPAIFSITVNSVIGVGSQQLTVTGHLRDGTTLNLTSTQRGTNYASSDLNVCNFGAPDGRVFGAANGPCVITVTNSGFTATAAGTVTNFTPTALASIAIPGYANNVDANGGYAYVAAGSTGLTIVNVSNPTTPVIVASLDTPGNANDVRVIGNRVYVADGSSGLRIIDVTTPTTPVALGSLDTPGEANDVIVSGNFAYVADGMAGVHIIDITDPALPRLVRTIDTPGTARGVDVEGTTLVVADDSPASALRVIDVANPATAAIVGSLPLPGPAIDVDLANGIAVVAAYTAGVQLVDVRVATAPAALGSIPGSSPNGFVPRDVQVAGQFALFAEQLFANAVAPIVDISDPNQPFFRGVLNFGLDYAGTGIAISGPHVYWTGQSFVVSNENGTSGTTRLFIGQYIALEDRNGVPPVIGITAPPAGTSAIEGTHIVVRADATDDVAVTAVTFTVNGAAVFTDTSEPFEARLTVPPVPGPMVLGAIALDYGNNTTSAAPVSVDVTPDPLTTVVGRVVDPSGTAIAGATVTVFTLQAQSASDGTFSIAGVPTILGSIRASAVTTLGGKPARGTSASLQPVPGGVTDVGTVRVSAFDGLYGAAFSGPNGPASLYEIDAATGQATLIGPIGFWRVGAIDASADGTLYAIGRNPADGKNVLLTIDPTTGAGTLIGPTGVESLGYGQTISDISFRPSDGVLFAYLEAGDGLGTINTLTGATTALGGTFTDCCGNGMAFAPDGRLLHANDVGFHVLNQTTGRVEFLFSLTYPAAVADEFPRISSMDFHPDSGELLGFLKSDVGTFLVRVDIVTGMVTIIGGATVEGLDAIVWGPRR